MTTLTEQQRTIVIMILLGISVFLTYYFHAVLTLGTVFSHFFYIPIILTALWWEKRSILVAIFLGGLVVASSFLYRPDLLTLNDYARVLMFVVIAFVVATLSEQLKGREREVKKQRDLAQRYLDVAGVLFVVINADHTIRLINRHGCELLGYQEEELLGKDWFTTVVPEAVRETRRQIFDTALAAGTPLPDRRESPVITRNGDELVLAWQDPVFAGDDGRPVAMIGSGADITDRIRAEEALRAAHNEANLYLDIMVHDINNANAVALGYADLLSELLGEKEKQMVWKLRKGISRSIEIIQNVTTIRRLHSSETATRPVDLDTVIQAEIAHHPDAGIVYTGKPVQVMADDLLPEVFSNLIGNSIKFGEPGVEVAVRVEEDDETVEVSIEDTGPGVPDEVKPSLFTRFMRGTNARSGKGLGLYITKMLIERYGGSIRVDDRVPGHSGYGAAFRFTLRRYDRPWEPPTSPAAPAAAGPISWSPPDPDRVEGGVDDQVKVECVEPAGPLKHLHEADAHDLRPGMSADGRLQHLLHAGDTRDARHRKPAHQDDHLRVDADRIAGDLHPDTRDLADHPCPFFVRLGHIDLLDGEVPDGKPQEFDKGGAGAGAAVIDDLVARGEPRLAEVCLERPEHPRDAGELLF